MFKNIIVAHDGTPCSDLALNYAFDLAKTFDGRITVCHVTDFSSAALAMAGPAIVNGGPVYEALHEESESIEAHVRDLAAHAGVPIAVCDIGNTPATGILETAGKSGADLIIVGSHGKRGLRKVFDPSISLQIGGRAHVPILIVPHGAPQCQ